MVLLPTVVHVIVKVMVVPRAATEGLLGLKVQPVALGVKPTPLLVALAIVMVILVLAVLTVTEPG